MFFPRNSKSLAKSESTLQETFPSRYVFKNAQSKKIKSYPAFNATEAHYLRCQIARISAATVVSPAGYYMPDPEEAEAEGGGMFSLGHWCTKASATIIINTEYEGLPNDQLLNTANWVHHVPYILPQGRITWENPFAGAKGEGDEEKEEEEEEKEEEGENTTQEPETGPTILSPLNADEGEWFLKAYIL